MSMYEIGTITGAAGARVINGSGTQWANNLYGVTVGSVLMIYGAGTVDAYQITKVVSNTQVEVSRALAKAVSNVSYGIITSETASTASFSNQLIETMDYYRRNVLAWQKIVTETGDVTITAPDGTTVTVPSMKGIRADLDKKANKDDLGNSSSRNVGSTAGTVAAGDDKRLNTIDGKSGGKVSSRIVFDGAWNGVKIENQTSNSYVSMYEYASTAPIFTDIRNNSDGQFYPLWVSKYYYPGTHAGAFWGGLLVEKTSPSFITGFTNEKGVTHGLIKQSRDGDLEWIRNISCVSLSQASDRDLKDGVENIEDALSKVLKLNGVTFIWKESGLPSAGVIAQEVKEVLPESISSQVNPITEERNYAVEYPALIGLLVEAIKELSGEVNEIKKLLN